MLIYSSYYNSKDLDDNIMRKIIKLIKDNNNKGTSYHDLIEYFKPILLIDNFDKMLSFIKIHVESLVNMGIIEIKYIQDKKKCWIFYEYFYLSTVTKNIICLYNITENEWNN